MPPSLFSWDDCRCSADRAPAVGVVEDAAADGGANFVAEDFVDVGAEAQVCICNQKC